MCLRRYAAICARQRRTRRLRQCRQLKSPARLVQLPPVFSFLYRSTAWFLRKVLAAVVIVSLALVTYAVYLFLHDTTDLDATRAQRIAILSHRQETLLAERTEVEGRIESLRVKLSIEQERADRAGRVIDTLESLRSRWERWFGNAAQQRNNDEQIARMKNVQSDARQVVLQLQRSITQAAWEREGLEVAIEPVERELTALQKVHSPALHYLNTAWYRARWIIAVCAFLYFFGAWFGRVVLFYGVAPFISRGRAIRFLPDIQQLPEVTPLEGSIAASLWPGEILAVRRRFLGERNEAVTRGKRLLLDWRLPLTSWFSGLVNLVELHNRHAGGEQRVALSGSGDTPVEFALVQVAEGSSLIVRPRFLAGFVYPSGQRLKIRARWRLLHRQSWATLQFRFLEFVGPCRLIVAAPEGLRVEQLGLAESGPRASRRVSPLAAIAFTPGMDCALVRTDRFWRYVRGRSDLVEMSFAGPGILLAKSTSTAPSHGFGRSWSRRRDRLLRVFGA